MTQLSPEPIRSLIVDDEPLARRTIRLLLENDPDIIILGECSNGRDAIEVIRREQPDLLFLDVQMPEVTGFDVLAASAPADVGGIIFTTAYDTFAIQAFEVHALDYLLKPFTDERFARAVERAKTQLRTRQLAGLTQKLHHFLTNPAAATLANPVPPSLVNPPPGYLKRLSVKTNGKVFFLKVADIEWIEAADQYVLVHIEGSTHLLRDSLNHLEAQLDPNQFFRLHRSALVNLDFVRELELHDRNDGIVIVRSGARLKVSRQRRELFQTVLTQRA